MATNKINVFSVANASSFFQVFSSNHDNQIRKSVHLYDMKILHQLKFDGTKENVRFCVFGCICICVCAQKKILSLPILSIKFTVLFGIIP